MNDFIEKLLITGATQNSDRRAQASDNLLAMMDRAYLKNLTEADPIQAAAIRQVMHREGPIGAQPPSA